MRDRILYESIASLRQEGLRFSVDSLAERLNISKKTVYKYFPNKEELALALYQRYYTDLRREVDRLLKEGTVCARVKLLTLYFDAKSMTSCDIFNKYKLNESIYAYTAEQNDAFLEILFSSLRGDLSEGEKDALRIIVNGSFEKLCKEKIAPEGVIERLVEIIW